MTILLDVNLLIALIDPSHINHDSAHRWFDSQGKHDWATCPVTQNGLIRIISQPRFPNTPGPPSVAAGLLRQLCALPGHRFWPDEISLLEGGLVDMEKVLTSAQITDVYLLALAVRRAGSLATLDRKLPAHAVSGGSSALIVVAP